ILGLGLVVAITAVLLAGTFKGLTSYMATMKTMDSKSAELQKAYELKNAVQSLAAKPLTTQTEKSAADQKKEIEAKLETARAALENYDQQLQDTLNRHRDPDDGFVSLNIVKQLRVSLADLKKELGAVKDEAEIHLNQSGSEPVRMQKPIDA